MIFHTKMRRLAARYCRSLVPQHFTLYLRVCARSSTRCDSSTLLSKQASCLRGSHRVAWRCYHGHFGTIVETDELCESGGQGGVVRKRSMNADDHVQVSLRLSHPHVNVLVYICSRSPQIHTAARSNMPTRHEHSPQGYFHP